MHMNDKLGKQNLFVWGVLFLFSSKKNANTMTHTHIYTKTCLFFYLNF